MHQGVDAFGQLVRDEATPGTRGRATDVRAVAAALEGLHEARTRLEEVLVTASVPELVELTAAVLATVRRLLQEMDLDERIRRQMRSSRFAARVRTGPAGRASATAPAVGRSSPLGGQSPPAGADADDSAADADDDATELMPRIDLDATTQLMARIERDRLTGEPRLPDDSSSGGSGSSR